MYRVQLKKNLNLNYLKIQINIMDVVKTYDNASPEEKKLLEVAKAAEQHPHAEDDDNDIMSHLNYRKLQKIKEDFIK